MFFCSVYHVGFYVAYLVIRRMCLIVLLTADPFFFFVVYSREFQATITSLVPDVWDSSMILHGETWVVFFSYLFSLQQHWAFIIDNNNCLSQVSMDTTIDLSDKFDTCVVHLCTFPAYLSPLPACSLFTATSSTQLEDLSFLDNQRAAGHRGSVRKHNTAGRINDDLKGILWINLEVRSACKYSLQQTQKSVLKYFFKNSYSSEISHGNDH